ncbi:MAG: DUF262 domain-containing protein [Burkholderiaceae bacterium]|uniref:DUF262 domain-containing protein n=1 Tax=Hydrogenophaga sp. TaxID=1904254 RepID=UPI00275808A5|nr:DUF262 domain-containing protein [Hydrogenophaga sp.]MDP2065068.1 DUF262 domain-containing protein [Burkholderiaceae bacterium]MDZ4145877.1 DUF262 domain-containing protein [Burkholderiales bacterium]MDZ4396267.1 DUF262 domain-containing protein [Hydrogenophaga sp.]
MAKKVQIDDDFDDLPNVQPPDGIVAFNELRSCADLYRLYAEGSLEIQPEFQREVVWLNPEKGRFIDSLTKQLPIPSMCFSLDAATEKRQVIDGLQRMASITSFLNAEVSWRLPRVKDIDPLISGKTNHDIRDGSEKQRVLYRRVQNLSIPITVIRCDSNRADHAEYLFTIFSRLNSGGQRLKKQEIRNCIFSGTFNNSIKLLDANKDWEKLKKQLPGQGKRFRSIESILRFFAIIETVDNGTLEKMSGSYPIFLNDYMRRNRNLNRTKIAIQNKIFSAVVKQINRIKFQDNAPLTYAMLESTMVGIYANLEAASTQNSVILSLQAKKLSNSYSIASQEVKSGTSSSAKIKARIQTAIETFR